MRRLDKHKETVEFSLDTAYTKNSITHLVLDTLSLLCYYKFEREEHPNYWLRVFNLSLCVNGSSIKEKLYPMGFFKDMFQGLGNFFKDPLNLNSRDREEEHFAQQQANWEKEFALQKDQFEYQKWFDQNNVTLNLKQNMDAGINPLAAQGAGSSSVSSSASPQQPSQGVGGADMSILGDLVSQLGANRREDESLKVAKDKIDKDKDTQDQIIALKRDELGLEEKRTDAYGKDVNARVLNLMQEYKAAQEGGYGRGSTFYKKLYGEIKNELEKTFGPFGEGSNGNLQGSLNNLSSKDVKGVTSELKRPKTPDGKSLYDEIVASQHYKEWAARQAKAGKRYSVEAYLVDGRGWNSTQ